MTFGEEGKEQARVHDVKDIESILDLFKSCGHTEVREICFLNFRGQCLNECCIG